MPPLPTLAARLALAALLAAMAALALATARAQPDEPTLVSGPLIWQTEPPAPAQPALAQPPPGPTRIFLPQLALVTPPPTTVRFGSGLADGVLTGEAETFPLGLTALYYRVEVTGAAGKLFREEWRLDGVRRPELDRMGSLPSDDAAYASGITLSTGAPLPPGRYELRVLVDGVLSGVGAATIQ